MRSLLALALVLMVGAPGSAYGQSLAAVAEKEEARRKAVKKSSRVYTNKDVRPAADARTPSSNAAGADAAAAQGSQAPAAPGEAERAGEGGQPAAEGEKPLSDEEQRQADEEQWRSRMADARTALERSQILAEALQTRINSLWMDFTARDDPAQRAVIDAERKKAIAQLDRVKADIVAQTKAIADIEEEARRAGVPPGWLR